MQRAADYLAKEADGKVASATFKGWLANGDLTFTTVPHGIMKYARFMNEIGYLSKVPTGMRELELPTIAGQGD